MAMSPNAKLFKRGIEAAIAKKLTLKSYIIDVKKQTPEHFQQILDAARAELDSIEADSD